MTKKVNKLWGTAFSKTPKEEAVQFCSGRDVQGLPPADQVLIPYEIKASIAYTKGLADQKIISKTEAQQLVSALNELQKLYQAGKFDLDPQKEDVHSNIESWLIKKLGIDVAGKIHSGRSRSEQAVVDIILYLKEANEVYCLEVKKLIQSLEKSAKKYAEVLIPGYTHYQQATVTTFGNILDSYAKTFEKDLKKMKLWYETEEVDSLGAGASYGSTFPINKHKINRYLGLKQVFDNEISVISTKGDAELQFVFNLAVFLNHLSSLAQTLIVFSTKEFGFIKISDEYSTGSSIMPQKKNPDTLEVIKAKASMMHGYLMSLLSLNKASFVGYNRDLQWSKYLVMDALSEADFCPKIMAGVISTMKVNQKTMVNWTTKGFILAQAVMEGLSQDYKLPMRLAKLICETLVKKCGEKGEFDLKKLNKIVAEFKLNFIVSEEKYKTWTDPMSVALKQMKR